MALLRLLGAGWVLVRADALLPREAQGLMPAPLVAPKDAAAPLLAAAELPG